MKSTSLTLAEPVRVGRQAAPLARRLAWGMSLGLLILAPLAFGAVHTWAYFPLGLATAGISVLLLLGGAYLTLVKADASPPLPAPPLWGAALAAVLLVWLQTWPLSPGLVGWLSPEALAIRKLGGGLGLAPSMALSLNPYATLLEFLKLWPVVIFFYILVYTTQSRRQVEALVGAVLAVASFEVLYGLWHLHDRLIWGWKDLRGGTRLCGTFINPDHLAAFLTLAILLGLGLFLSYREAPAKDSAALSLWQRLSRWSQAGHLEPRLRRFALLLLLLFLAVGLVLTGSRGGMLALLAGFSLMGFFMWRKRHRWSSILLLAFLLAAAVTYSLTLGSDSVLGRLQFFKEDGFRYQAAIGALAIFRQFPWLGAGIGTFGDLFYRFEPASLGGTWFVYAHNDWLQVLAETGAAGFILVAGTWLLFFHRLVRGWQRRQDPYAQGLLLGCLGALGAGAIHALVDFPFRLPGMTLTYAAIAAIGFLALHLQRRPLDGFSYPVIKLPVHRRLGAAVLAGLVVLQGLFMVQVWLYWQAERAAPLEIDSTRAKPHLTTGDLGRALSFNPINSQYYRELAKALEAGGTDAAGSLSRAEQALRQAVFHAPADWTHHLRLADFYQTHWRLDPERQLPLALQELDSALKLFPGSGFLHYRLGTLLAWMERYHSALVPADHRGRWFLYLMHAVQLDPDLKPHLNPGKS